MTDAERRDKARLRSKKWRRPHGIMPRRKAARPWLALGISRSTYYRRRAKAREQAAAATATAARQAALDRLDWQLARLQRELVTAARFVDEGRRSSPSWPRWQAAQGSGSNSLGREALRP